MAKKSNEPQKPSTAWQGTYGDMITLMLCFFVMLYDPSEVDTTTLSQIQASLAIQEESMENPTTTGGMSLTAGRLADLGNTVNSLPSVEKGKSLGLAKKKAISLLGGEISRVKDYAIPGTDVHHRLILIKKIKETPKKYPRAFAKIKMNPL